MGSEEHPAADPPSARPAEDPLLEARGLTVHIAGHCVCQALSLTLAAGRCWGLLGRNGAGKTTLLHTLAGLRPPEAGTLHLCGRPLAHWSGRERARRLGVLFQDHREVFPSTVLETVLIGRHPHLSRWGWEGPEDVAAARAALAAVDLAGYEARAIGTLSGGEYQRLQLATLLAQDPRVLLLDEPVNHLDLRHQLALLDLLADLAAAGRTVLMVVHDVNLAARACDHFLLLYGDGSYQLGPREVVLEKEALERLYGAPLQVLTGRGGRRWFLPG